MLPKIQSEDEFVLKANLTLPVYVNRSILKNNEGIVIIPKLIGWVLRIPNKTKPDDWYFQDDVTRKIKSICNY